MFVVKLLACLILVVDHLKCTKGTVVSPFLFAHHWQRLVRIKHPVCRNKSEHWISLYNWTWKEKTMKTLLKWNIINVFHFVSSFKWTVFYYSNLVSVMFLFVLLCCVTVVSRSLHFGGCKTPVCYLSHGHCFSFSFPFFVFFIM